MEAHGITRGDGVWKFLWEEHAQIRPRLVESSNAVELEGPGGPKHFSNYRFWDKASTRLCYNLGRACTHAARSRPKSGIALALDEQVMAVTINWAVDNKGRMFLHVLGGSRM